MLKCTLFLLFFLMIMALTHDVVQSRVIRSNSSESGLVSDGININEKGLIIDDEVTIINRRSSSSSVMCESMYGFLPCASNSWGQLFLFVVYQYLIYLGDKFISNGSELIFKILGPGVLGASAFHILGSLPEAVLVLVSGINGSNAEDQVMSGMSILAGSTVLLLTLLLGICGIVDRIDLSMEKASLTQQDNIMISSSNMCGSGDVITTDNKTSWTARIMLVSMIPFIIAQLPHIFGLTTHEHIWTLISLIVSLSILVTYCFGQVFMPWIQDRRLAFVINKYVRSKLLHKLLTFNGKPNTEGIKELFHSIDASDDGFITHDELRGFITGIKFEEIGLEADDLVEKLMNEFDITGDAHIDLLEFVKRISKWLAETQQPNDKQVLNPQNLLSSLSYKKPERTQGMQKKAVVDERALWIYTKAICLLLLGTFILTILTEPIINTVENMSNAANIPSFFIFFIVVPIALNYREAIATISSIRQKSQFSASLTFSEIYTAVFMNNIVGIAMSLGIVYAKGFTWNFSAEMLIVLIVCLAIGLYAGFCTSFPLWTFIVACLLYPASVVLLYVLTYFLGWG